MKGLFLLQASNVSFPLTPFFFSCFNSLFNLRGLVSKPAGVHYLAADVQAPGSRASARASGNPEQVGAAAAAWWLAAGLEEMAQTGEDP